MEIVAFILSLICVSLNAKGHVLTWPFAIASSTSYAWVFQDAQLFGDAALQFVFVALAIYAWVQWAGIQTSKVLPPPPVNFGRIAKRFIILCTISWAGLFVMIRWVLIHYTSSDIPSIDAFLTAGSLIATYMSAHKWLENWLVWVFVDLIYVGLYIYKDLYLTALLYTIFIALCIWGWKQWSRKILDQSRIDKAL